MDSSHSAGAASESQEMIVGSEISASAEWATMPEPSELGSMASMFEMVTTCAGSGESLPASKAGWRSLCSTTIANTCERSTSTDYTESRIGSKPTTGQICHMPPTPTRPINASFQAPAFANCSP